MSQRHEGVSCDSCLKSNFRGRRYKCLICYDYDLCANCYEDGATSTRHTIEHPMQCILTRSDFELFYGGEILPAEQPQSFTCPCCKRMGFSDSTLFEHVGAEHTDTGIEVVCPICAALPGGDPNLVTDDFAGHLTLEHRTGPRDLISFLDEPSSIRHGGVRRIPHTGRALGGPRSRRSNMHFSSSTGLSALSPSGGRDAVDPIAELLSQLSGVRRGAPQPSQLQQLQMQIQLERQQASAARQQLERLPRRQAHPIVSSANTSNLTGVVASTSSNILSASAQQPQTGNPTSAINNRGEIAISSSAIVPSAASSLGSATISQNQANQSQYLFHRFMTPTLDENELIQMEHLRADRSQYVQALLLSTLSNIQRDPILDLSNTIEHGVQSLDLNVATDEELRKDNENNQQQLVEDISQNTLHVTSQQRGAGIGGGGGGGGGGGTVSKIKSSSTNKSGSQNVSGEQQRRGKSAPHSTKNRDMKSSAMPPPTKEIPDSR